MAENSPLVGIIMGSQSDWATLRHAAEILDFDLLGLFDGLELISHLSPARGNGLAAMVKRIKSIAAQELRQ